MSPWLVAFDTLMNQFFLAALVLPDDIRSLPSALALLTLECLTPEHRQMLRDEVFAPIDQRRQRAGFKELSQEERGQLLARVRLALARAIDAYRDG